MILSSWIHVLFGRQAPTTPNRRAKHRTRLGCQQLEDRLTPATIVVDLAIDEDDGNVVEGDMSLREAIKLANRTSVVDTITFSPTVFAASQTIPLTLGRMAIAQPLNLIGPGADRLVIDANTASQIFFVDGSLLGIVVNIEGITMKRGFSESPCNREI